MADNTSIVATKPILLTMDQVPLGSTVYLIDPGTRRPLQGEDGVLAYPLRKLVGGVNPMGAWLYPIDVNGKLYSGLRSVFDEVRFTPVDTFTIEDAPPETTYAVFVDGEPMFNGQEGFFEGQLYVYKHLDGSFVTQRFRSPQNRKWILPTGAQLVPTSEIGKAKDPLNG